MAIFGSRNRRQKSFDQFAVNSWIEMAKVQIVSNLREALWEQDFRAEGVVAKYEEGTTNPVYGYVILLSSELLWIYMDDDDVSRADISSGYSLFDLSEFAPGGSHSYIVQFAEGSTPYFMVEVGSALAQAFRTYADE